MKIPLYCITALLFCVAPSVRADDITLTNGKTLHNAKITSSDAATVTIKYSTGIIRVMIPELPPEVRSKIKYDSDEAAKQLQNEQRTTADASAMSAREIEAARKRDTEQKAYDAALEAWQKSLVTIRGTLQQVTEDGILVFRENDKHPVFIKHADPGGYVDGDIVSIQAAPCSPYAYGNVRGGGSTVRAFDAAPPPRPSSEEGKK